MKRSIVSGAVIAAVLFITMESRIACAAWTRVIGTPDTDILGSVARTSDGGSVIAGASWTDDGSDTWLVRMDRTGNVLWQRKYYSERTEYPRSIIETRDGGFMLLGDTRLAGGKEDIWCARLDSAGNVQWQQTYGGADTDWGVDVVEVSSAGFLIAAHTMSFGLGLNDVWILYIDSSGGIVWQRTYGSPDQDYVSSLYLTGDGGWGFIGSTDSAGAGRYDIWCVRVGPQGSILWQTTFGGHEMDSSAAGILTPDGGVLAVGYTRSFGAGAADLWCIKLDREGRVQWQQAYGGAGFDDGLAVTTTPDGGYVLTGRTMSFGHGLVDLFFLRIGPTGDVRAQKAYGTPESDLDIDCAIVAQPDGHFLVTVGSDGWGNPEGEVVALSVDGAGLLASGCEDRAMDGSAVGVPTNALVVPTNVAARLSNGVAGVGVIRSSSASLSISPLCDAPAAADIAGSWGRIRSNGSRMRARLACVNIGSADAAQIMVHMYLSPDRTFGAAARLVDSRSIDSLRAGARTTLRVRTRKNAADHFLIAVLDAVDSVEESDEANNIVVAAF